MNIDFKQYFKNKDIYLSELAKKGMVVLRTKLSNGKQEFMHPIVIENERDFNSAQNHL